MESEAKTLLTKEAGKIMSTYDENTYYYSTRKRTYFSSRCFKLFSNKVVF